MSIFEGFNVNLFSLQIGKKNNEYNIKVMEAYILEHKHGWYFEGKRISRISDMWNAFLNVFKKLWSQKYSAKTKIPFCINVLVNFMVVKSTSSRGRSILFEYILDL